MTESSLIRMLPTSSGDRVVLFEALLSIRTLATPRIFPTVFTELVEFTSSCIRVWVCDLFFWYSLADFSFTIDALLLVSSAIVLRLLTSWSASRWNDLRATSSTRQYLYYTTTRQYLYYTITRNTCFILQQDNTCIILQQDNTCIIL